MHPKNGLSDRRHYSCTIPTGFGNSVIYSPAHFRKMHRSTSIDSKMFVAVIQMY